MAGLEYQILHKNVFYFPRLIENIQEVLLALEEVNSLSVTPWETWYANNDAKENPYGDLKTLSYTKLTEEQDLQIKEKSSFILNSILGGMEKACREYLIKHDAAEEELDHLNKEIFSPANTYGIRRYDENKDMGLHQDMVVEGRDTITIAVYLDDNYEGGELGIIAEKNNLTIKNQAGSIVVFPSSYFHESKPLLSGRKTMMTHVHMPMNKVLQDVE